MTAAFLLFTAMLAADNPAPVQTRVLYGTAADQQHGADIDLWISQAVAKNGSPLALPYTGWIVLTGEHQRLYTANGFIIEGKATENEGKYQVENAKKRAEAMEANAKTFVLELQYNGGEDKPFYRMIVSVPVVNRRRNSPFNRIVQVKEDEAIRIIGHLAREGFLDKAIDLRTKIKIPPPAMPGYTMKVVTGDMPLYEDLGWGLPMIHRLDALRNALPKNNQKNMDLLLGRLSGLRKQWEAEHPPFEAEVIATSSLE